MRYAFVSDVHIWNHRECGGAVDKSVNERARGICRALQRAIRIAESYRCEWFLILGDIFESWRPEPQLVALAKKSMASSGLKVAAMVGNHDQVSADEGDHAIVAMMDPFDTDRGGYIDRPCVVGDVAVFPYVSMGYDVWLEDAMKTLGKTEPFFAAAIHMGIQDETAPSYLHGAGDSVEKDELFKIMNQCGVTHVFAGHWHWHKRWTQGAKSIVQCGALVPNGWREPGFRGVGKLTIWDASTSHMFVENVPGPRFIDVEFKDGMEFPFPEEARAEGVQVYACIRSGYEDLSEAADIIQKWKRQGWIEGGKALPRIKPIDAETCGRMLARHAHGIEHKIDKYLAGVCNRKERHSIMRRLKGYLSV